MVKTHATNRVSIAQIEFLAQCMEQFPSLVLANFGKSREETSCVRNKWLHIGSALNKIKPGVTKTGVGWLRYWTIYKYQLRKKYPQFKLSWLSNESTKVTPLEHRFLRVLADCERSQPLNTTDNQNAKTNTTDKEKAPERDFSIETSQSMPTKQEISQSMPKKQETTQSISIIPVVEVYMEKMESPDIHDDDNIQDENSTEDPIGTEKETKEEIQIELLKFNLKRQREMHELEIKQMKERHKLELEILELKKKKLMNDCENLRNSVYKVINR